MISNVRTDPHDFSKLAGCTFFHKYQSQTGIFLKQDSVPSCRSQWLAAFLAVLWTAVSQWGLRELWGCGLPGKGTRSGRSVWACCRPVESRPCLVGRLAVWQVLQGHCLFSVASLGPALGFVLHHGPAASLPPTHSQSAVEKSLRRSVNQMLTLNIKWCYECILLTKLSIDNIFVYK